MVHPIGIPLAAMVVAALGVGRNLFAQRKFPVIQRLWAAITVAITVTSQTVAVCNGRIPTMEAVGRMSIPWPGVRISRICVELDGAITTATIAAKFSPLIGVALEAQLVGGILV
ncbi:MAG: hypothetical protein ACPHCV_00650 [Pseudohongiellaceae bacterium]